MKVCKHASMQICMDTNVQVYKYASMQVCKYRSMQVCKYASIKYAICKYASMKVCKCASIYSIHAYNHSWFTADNLSQLQNIQSSILIKPKQVHPFSMD